MTQFARVVDQTSLSVSFIESSDPEDLQNRINALIAAVDVTTTGIAAITLAGAGDGKSFCAIFETAPVEALVGNYLTGTSGGVPTASVRCYLAGSADELPAARARAGAPAPISGPQTLNWAIADEQVAGGSKGTPFMGMTVYSLLAAVQNLGIATGQAVLETTPFVLAGGLNYVAFETVTGLNFTLPSPTVLQYNGFAAVLALFQVNATVEQTNAGDVSVNIVTDPLGTPVVVGPTTKTHVGNQEYDNVSVQWVGPLEPFALSTTLSKYGIQVTAAGAGEVVSAALTITEL